MENKITLSRNQQIKILREAFAAIPNLQDGFHDVAERLYDMNVAAERQHRRGQFGRQIPLSVKDAAKLFTVQHLLDGFAGPDRFSVADILSIRTEVLYAQAYAKKHRTELTEWAAKYAKYFSEPSAVNYSQLMSAL